MSESKKPVRATDPLTGLPHRDSWLLAVDKAIADERPFALVLIDIDRFSAFNKHYGYERGDEVLRDVATRLSNPGVLSCRLSGDEFTLLVFDGDPFALAEEARRTTAQALVAFDIEAFRESTCDPTRERALDPGLRGATVVAHRHCEARSGSAYRLLARLDEALQVAQSSGGRNLVHLVE